MKLSLASELAFVPASHENPSDPGVLKKVLLAKEHLHSGQVQMVNWSLLKVGKQFCPHYHQDMQEVFVLVAGKAKMLVWPADCSGKSRTPNTKPVEIEMQPGDTVLVEPNEVHMMTNVSDQDVHYIVFGVSAERGGKTVNVDWKINSC